MAADASSTAASASGEVSCPLKIARTSSRSLPSDATRANQKASPWPTATYAWCAAVSAEPSASAWRPESSARTSAASMARARVSADQVRYPDAAMAARAANTIMRRTHNLAIARFTITSRTRMADADVVAIVNPLSGAGATGDAAGRRIAFLERRFAAAGIAGRVHVTERGGHARELARAALDRGVSLVIAWGGDGTINEVASTLAGSRTPLGIIPAGSGNGFANERSEEHTSELQSLR